MLRTRALLMTAFNVSVAFLVAACGGAGASSSGRQSVPATAPASSSVVVHTKTVQVAGTSMTVLANAQGKTLYYFQPDSATHIACSGACAQAWPPLLASTGTPASASSLPGTLSAITGANGRQVVYNGHPLYTYSKDGDEGDAYGQGVGGVWFVATP